MHVMAQAGTRGAAADENPSQVMQQNLASLTKLQKELLQTLERIQRDQMTRAMEQTRLASEFAGSVANARSVPQIMTAYQEWFTAHTQMLAEDNRKLMSDCQNTATAMLRLLSGGFSAGGST
jgi:hypothetical protein